jgi:hypothetical protein
MISNSHNENLINRNIRTDIFSIINDNSFNNKNPSQGKSSEYMLTNKQDDKEKIESQKLMLSTSTEKNNGDINQHATLCMKTEDNELMVGWTPSVDDIFAENWTLVF